MCIIYNFVLLIFENYLKKRFIIFLLNKKSSEQFFIISETTELSILEVYLET